MPRHLEKRRRRWYAILDIPAALRPRFGGKRRFLKSLETADLATAQRRLVAVIAGWQSNLALARPQPDRNPLQTDAEFYYKLLRAAATAAQREAVMERVQEAADAVGYLHAEVGQPPASTTEAQEFVSKATGALTTTLEHLEEWLGSLIGKPRTKDQRRTGARRVARAFPLLRDITKPAVRQWAAGLPLSRRSTSLILGGMSVYWRWLQVQRIVPEGESPFEGVDLVRGAPIAKRRAFSPKDVVKLRAAAPDAPMRDLITLAMWSGCRIEELCALRVSAVGPASFRVMDAKTAAGVREVPIHAKLRPTLDRLLGDSADGYVMAGLPFNKYGERSSTIGRRFSGFKSRMGFGPDQVFHSIRRTVVTMLENAGVSENLCADVVGHEKPRITYGLYSGGATLEVKAAALALLDYPQV